MALFYWLMKTIVLGPVLRLLYRPTVQGIDNIPQDGPAILVVHSYGGTVITQAGANPKVKALVLLAVDSAASHLHLSGTAALRGVFGLYVGLVCVHFLVDARLWRLSQPFPRAFLGARLPFLFPPVPPAITRLPIDRVPI